MLRERVLTALVLIGVLLVRPGGLFGTSE